MPLAGDYVTKVVPSKMEKQIEENKAKYGKRIKQLSHIIGDNYQLSLKMRVIFQKVVLILTTNLYSICIKL